MALMGACCLVLLAYASTGNATAWVGTWGAAPLPPSPALGPIPATPGFSNQTIRQIIRISAGGTRLRVRFTNEYGAKPLRIGAARIALASASGEIEKGTERTLLFDGKPGTLIPADAPFISDPVDLPTKALAHLSISIYFPEDTGPCTCHATGMQNAYVSDTGDFTSGPFTPKQTIQSRAFISGIEVETSAPAKALVVLGDSISDGVGSTVDTDRRWPDLLAARLAGRGDRAAWGVVNMGISGNRVLENGAGESALARFDRDVLSVPGGSYVIVFEGINDLGLGFGHFQGPLAAAFQNLVPANKPTAAAMIAGYRQIITRAHTRGLKVIGATITPYGGAGYYSAEGEAIRQQLNTWIRSAGAFDGVLDFDAAIRDPHEPSQIAAGLHAGDHLHGSDAGYAAMAKSIDVSLFK
jgi:lysophospholipase L1-like esterase